MRQLIYLYLVFFALFSCESKSMNTTNSTIKTNNMSKIEFNITFSFKNVGYQIFINNILIDQRLNGGMNNSFNINEFLINQEKQKITIKLFGLNGRALSKNDIESQECVIFRNDKETDNFSTFHKFNFQGRNNELPVFELSSEILVNDKTPKLGAEVLSNAVNLSDIEKNILEKKLKEKYEQIRNELNDGNYNYFIGELEIRNKIYFESNYYTDNERQKYISNATKMLNEYKSKMLPIENYKMIISANGKLCTFERIDKDYVGNGVLLAKNIQDKVLYLNYITFFIPKNEQELKVFSLNSNATSL